MPSSTATVGWWAEGSTVTVDELRCVVCIRNVISNCQAHNFIEDLQRRWVPTSKYFIYAYLCIPWRHIEGMSAIVSMGNYVQRLIALIVKKVVDCLFIGFPNVWKEEDDRKLPWAGQTQYQGVWEELPNTVVYAGWVLLSVWAALMKILLSVPAAPIQIKEGQYYIGCLQYNNDLSLRKLTLTLTLAALIIEFVSVRPAMIIAFSLHKRLCSVAVHRRPDTGSVLLRAASHCVLLFKHLGNQ